MIYERDDQYRIKKKMFEFIHVLKDAGIYISTSEILDVFEGLQFVDFNRKEVFRQTLATTLVKDYTDIPVFDKCFMEFFEKKLDIKGFDPSVFLQDTLNTNSLKQKYQITEAELEELQKQIDTLVDDIFTEHGEKHFRHVMNILLEDPQATSSSGALGQLLFNVRSRFAQPQMGGEGERSEGDEEERFLEELIIQKIRRRGQERNIGRSLQRRDDYLLNRYIYRLTPEEVKEMRDTIKRFGQKLKNRISLRKKRVKRGGIDIKRTLRKNLQYGGTPFRIYHRDRKIDRPQLVVLCDISGSVNQYSRFMLLLTYTLQSLFSKVRSFAFISNMVEITPLFMEMDPERALNSIFSDTNFTYGWGSNYGRCFDMFLRDYSDSLTHKTTVLVLGDGRNNNQDPGLDSFIRMKERSRNLFWLNPDKKHLWGWSDSIANLYQQYCTEMKQVNNFLDLSEFIDRLFIR